MNELNIAFKEWAVVVEALLTGKQTIIFRKGGIIEDKKTFSVDHENFLLMPTFFHQEKQDIIPSELDLLNDIQNKKPKKGNISIPGYMQVKEVHFLENLDKLKQFQPFGIWSEKCLLDRYNWGKHKGIHLILGRVYRLSEEVLLPDKESYKGCKSWVELDTTVHLEGASPALTEETFEETRERINSILSEDVPRAY